jgi:hypothetical protein
MSDEQLQDRGSDERFTGGGSQMWRPDDRNESRLEQGAYGNPGHWSDEAGGGYIGQSGQSMGYDEGYGQQPQRYGGRGMQGQGGMYGQRGYNEGIYGRGGQQNRYGSQGYQGGPSRYSNRMIGEPRYGGQQGYGQGFGQQGYGGFGAQGIGGGFSDQDLSRSGYWQQPEHATSFRGGPHGYGPQGPHGYGQQQMQGVHRGKGPTGYTRSDERIREMVCDVLTDHDHIDASTIEVAVKNGEVTLSGAVEDRRTKRMAEDVIENLSGVKEVVNQLRVSDRLSSSHKGVDKSGREHEQQGGNGSDKRHRA